MHDSTSVVRRTAKLGVVGLILQLASATPAMAQFALPLNPESRNSYRIRIAPCVWNGVEQPRNNALLANAQAAADLWMGWLPGGSVATDRWRALPRTHAGSEWGEGESAGDLATPYAATVAEECLAAHGGVGAREVVLVMLHPALDVKGRIGASWAFAGTVASLKGLGTDLKYATTTLAHEIGHGFGLQHSAGWAWRSGPGGAEPAITQRTPMMDGGVSRNLWPNKNYPWDYGDDGDIMGSNVPRLNPYSRERLGLTSVHAVQDYWSVSAGRYRLCDAWDPISKASATDIGRIPLDAANPNRYALIEYRAPRDSVGRITGDGTLQIYLVDDVTGYADSFDSEKEHPSPVRKSMLLRESRGVRPITSEPGKNWNLVYYSLGAAVQDAEIAVDGARPVRVRTAGPPDNPRATAQCRSVVAENVPATLTAESCAPGFVWREAAPGDRVCVAPQRRQAVIQTNASGRRMATCPSGLVHRLAVAARPGVDRGDILCVSPAERDLVRQENAAAYSRTFRAQASGPWSCKPGFVWRTANNFDRVCVAPEAAEAIAAQNRQRPLGCPNRADPRVSRNAWPGDSRCVTAAEASVVAGQNAEARNHWLWSSR